MTVRRDGDFLWILSIICLQKKCMRKLADSMLKFNSMKEDRLVNETLSSSSYMTKGRLWRT